MAGRGKGKGLGISWSTLLSWGRSKSLRVFILCFLVALVFWGLKSLNRDYQTNINMPIQVVYNDSSLIPLDPPPAVVPLRVSGYGWDLIRWTFGWKIEPLEIEPEGLPEKQFLTFPDYSEEITGKLQDLKLLNYLNTEVPLNFDFLNRKTVPIQFDSATIPFRENFYLERGLNVVPDSLTFIGPKSLLENLQDHYTLVLPFEAIDQDFSSSISVQFPHSELVSVVPEDINVSFPVGEWVLVERDYLIRQLQNSEPLEEPLNLTQNSAKVVFKLPEDSQPGPGFDSIELFVEVNLRDSLMQVQLKNLPDIVHEFNILPDTVKILADGASS